MASTFYHSFVQSPTIISNKLFSGEHSVLSPPSVKYRQPGNVKPGYSSYASVETESSASPSSTATLASPASFYEILGIQRGATIQEIKAAYRRLARVCHPDVAANIDQNESFMKINAAYCTLSDPKKRAQYDRSLFRRSPNINYYRGGCVTSRYTTRNWETDQCW